MGELARGFHPGWISAPLPASAVTALALVGVLPTCVGLAPDPSHVFVQGATFALQVPYLAAIVARHALAALCFALAFAPLQHHHVVAVLLDLFLVQPGLL